ncbi:Gfo/Idh/MocA family oxidoreductase [Streptomyces chumphonensis]|uniref:Gfo/Idh/MocA family oxidoreductase n=1 Tax=Streptomyces chumphonensis TaxID=1214925 RepID=A0A927F542_9ACTN|nr:Gfo/Idh/MocA family oxidoreductase [Streptomyces chumphonensis]MBD3934461.1 Gfo/Idh/MocA family oxidoreductase [Streptomyces chumphonensis]
MSLRLGVLGCADIAVRRMLPAVSRTPGVTLAAVGSRDAAKAAAVTARFGGAPVTGYAEVLARPDVDAVYVPLPAALHATWVRRALAAGKHVLAEKPLTTDAAATAALVAQARAAGLVLLENHLFVHHPQHRLVRRLLAEGAVGRPRAVSAAFTVPRRPAGDIRLRPELGGGALLDVGCYPLRAASLLLGSPLTVVGATAYTDPRYGVDVAGAALLRRPDGVTAQLTFGMDHHYTSRYEVLGTEGRLRLDHAFTPPADHRPTVVIERPDGVERVPGEPFDQCAGTVGAFVRAVTSRAGTAGEAINRQAELIAAVQRTASDAAGGDRA